MTSYSWASSDRVEELVTRLTTHGIDVIFDKADLKEGQDKYAFMEQSVNDPSIDKVLVICDKVYTEKANQRKGGVGDETVIISPEIYGKVGQEKFISIVFEVDSDGNPYTPAYIKSRIYIDLSTDDERYETNYEQLLRNLYNKPLYRKPALGKMPKWLENENTDFSQVLSIVKQIRNYTGENTAKSDFLIKNFKDVFVSVLKEIGTSTNLPIDEAILKQIDESKPLRDLYIDFLDVSLYSGFELETIIPSFFEYVYNETHNATEKNSCCNSEFEFYKFVIWELFICTTAVILNYERFSLLYDILNHTYFLRESPLSTNLLPSNYVYFRSYNETIEDICKPKSKNPRLFTLTGDIAIAREKKPLITKTSLSNADIVLYQMSRVFNLKRNASYYWFPDLYNYHKGLQSIWIKLESVAHCKKIMPLFGISTIEKLKGKIISNKCDNKDYQ